MGRAECCAWAMGIVVLWFVLVTATLMYVSEWAFSRALSH